jgi:hypothetical protein
MARRTDPEDGFAELLALWSAESADDLHRVLVLHWPVRRIAEASEPMALLGKHHKANSEGVDVTALLLMTDRRWQPAAGQLARRIADSGLIDDDGLDALAALFLNAGPAIFWPVPDDWFGNDEIVIELSESNTAHRAKTSRHPGRDLNTDSDDAGPAVAARQVSPPLRRWSAAHLLRRGPSSWREIWRNAELLDARGAAAVKCGVLDVFECLLRDAQELLIAESIRWPDRAVRQLGYNLMIDRFGVSAVRELAQTDANAQLRAWAAALRQPDQASTTRTDQPTSTQRRIAKSSERPTEQTLF